MRGKGYGRAALSAVITACQAMGLRRLLGVIGDSDNAGSIALHRALGFQPCGTLPAVGYKAGKWLDVVLMHLPLNGGDDSPPPQT
jgi:L-amino acid N-acyltransferase YncA